MSAALGGWGLSAAEEPTPAAAAETSSEAAAGSTAASAEQQPTDGTGDKPPPPPPRKEQDDEWKETVKAADVLTSVLQYNPLNSLASKWINELEKADDEHRPLRAHLLAHLKEWERSTYEEWVEECLVAIDGWDRSSAVVDGTFYEEDSLHRRLWNQRMEAIGDEGRTAEARGAAGKTSSAPGGDPAASVDEDETRTRATPAKTAAAKDSAAPAAEKSSAAKREDKGGTVASTSAVAAAMGLLDNDDDLDGLLGDEEICFVSKPSD